MDATARRVLWGRVVCAFLKAGWNPPAPSERGYDGIVEALEAYNRRTCDLSDRQLLILQQTADGSSPAQISEDNQWPTESVRTDFKRAVERLGATGRCHAVAVAMRKGLIT